MSYKTSEAVYAMINIEAITDLVNGISPFVRNRRVEFPAIAYDVGDEQYINDATTIHHRESSVDINIMARSQEEADDILDVCVTNLSHLRNTYAGQCVYSTVASVTRDYQEAEDSGSNGIFITTLTLNLQIS